MKKIICVGLLIISLLGSGCACQLDFNDRIDSIIRPYLFNIATWELAVIPQEINTWFFSNKEDIEGEVRLVTEYFTTAKRIKTLRSELGVIDSTVGGGDSAILEAELEELQERNADAVVDVEMILERQIRETLNEQGIYNPLSEAKFGFPPVNFKLEKPPNLLVISPRDRIESIREFTLISNLDPADRDDIESRIDELGVSSLVTGLGGLGATYPTFVTNDASLRFTIEAATEEWLHQYLVLKPLGFLYLLDVTGLARDYEISTINETVAGMVSEEIAAIVYDRYYSDYINNAGRSPLDDTEFDFNREMRETRQEVDAYLTQGAIEPAEEYMEQRRQYLVSMGYYIRRLNQAYFAFHGTYADKPAFINPIGLELKELREQSASLKDFLEAVSDITSRQELQSSIR